MLYQYYYFPTSAYSLIKIIPCLINIVVKTICQYFETGVFFLGTHSLLHSHSSIVSYKGLFHFSDSWLDVYDNQFCVIRFTHFLVHEHPFFSSTSSKRRFLNHIHCSYTSLLIFFQNLRVHISGVSIYLRFNMVLVLSYFLVSWVGSVHLYTEC